MILYVDGMLNKRKQVLSSILPLIAKLECRQENELVLCILEPPPQTQHLCLQCLVICLMQCFAEVLPRDLHCARSNDCIKIGQHYATHMLLMQQKL